MDVIRVEHRQDGYGVRLEWGREGAALLAAECAVVVVVDVLSFSTAVTVAVDRGAVVLPLRRRDERDLPAGVRAAVRRGEPGPSLSPASLRDLPAGTRLALPSPNGATLCAAVADADAVLLVGCLRNASAVAAAAHRVGGPIGIVPAGERWPDDTMRVAAEDAIGAGAIAAALPARERSPEAELAVAQFTAARDRGPADVLAAISSGRELIADGFAADVALAAELDASDAVPRLHDGFLRR